VFIDWVAELMAQHAPVRDGAGSGSMAHLQQNAGNEATRSL
jgi:hypothetical protein